MDSRATKRRIIADRLVEQIARLRKEVEDRRRDLRSAVVRELQRQGRLPASGFAAWSRHATALARAVGALDRAEKRLPGAADRAEVEARRQRERDTRLARIKAANTGYQRDIDQVRVHARAVTQQWKIERAQEADRLEAQRKRIRKRTYKDTGGDAVAASQQQSAWWNRPTYSLDPIVHELPDIAPADTEGLAIAPPPREGLIPGTFKVVDPSRLGGIVDRPDVPKFWTSRHVGMRLIEAHRILARVPASIWPKQFGKMWPEYRHDFAEQVVQAGAGLLFAGHNRVRIGATSEEIARMNEAIGWPMQFLSDRPLTAADVNRWAFAMTEEAFEKIEDGDHQVPWIGLRTIARALNAAKETVT